MTVGRRFVLLAGVAWLALPTNALAQQTLAPPGKAGADQYFETIPSANGNAAPPSAIAASPGGTAAGISALARLGKDGQSAAALAGATGPARGQHKASGAGDGGGSSLLSSLTHVLGGTDAGGLGIALPVLFGAALAAAIALALVRLRRRDETA